MTWVGTILLGTQPSGERPPPNSNPPSSGSEARSVGSWGGYQASAGALHARGLAGCRAEHTVLRGEAGQGTQTGELTSWAEIHA